MLVDVYIISLGSWNSSDALPMLATVDLKESMCVEACGLAASSSIKSTPTVVKTSVVVVEAITFGTEH